MKKLSYTLAILALFSVVVVAVSPAYTANAQEQERERDQIHQPTESNVAQPTNQAGDLIPVPVREKIRAEVKTMVGGEREDGALRNRLLEQRPALASTTMASTTRARIEDRIETRNDRIEQGDKIREEARNERRIASSSADRLAIRAKAYLDAFKNRQEALVKQLNLSVSNLEQIIGRVSDRIDKVAATGRDMTEAKQLLTVANDKLAIAKSTVQAVADYMPPSMGTASTTASSTDLIVNLEKPREIGAKAIEAVKATREAITEVVKAIAHAMGLNLGNATTTASTTEQ